jgi:hypothetical protein
LFADPDGSKLLAQFTEPFTRQWLCQYISNLPLSADMLNVQFHVPDTLPNEMKSDINVFTSIVEDMILTEGYSRLAIHLQDEGLALLAL